MGSGNAQAGAVRKDDEVFVWLAKSRFIGYAVALDDAKPVDPSTRVPWPDRAAYKITFPIRVIADASDAPVGPPWNTFKSETGTKGRPDWSPRVPEAAVPLVRNYFDVATASKPSAIEQQILDSLQLAPGDMRKVVEVMAVVREGQTRFRDGLLSAYDRRCAISQVNTEAVLDAAHISAYNGPSSNDVRNGMLLRRDLHSLFDRHLLTVRPDGTVDVDISVDADLYRSVHGRRARFPRNAAEQPDVALLSAHNRKFDTVSARRQGALPPGR